MFRGTKEITHTLPLNFFPVMQKKHFNNSKKITESLVNYILGQIQIGNITNNIKNRLKNEKYQQQKNNLGGFKRKMNDSHRKMNELACEKSASS